MSDLRTNVAQNIILLRTESGLTQAELAEKINYTNKAVSKWEHGDAMPDIEVLEEIAHLFGQDINFMFNSPSKNVETLRNEPVNQTPKLNTQKLLLSLLVIAVIWTIGAVIFAYTNVTSESGEIDSRAWFVFLWCVPASMLLMLIFSSVWNDGRTSLLWASLFIWTLLICFFVQFIENKIFLIFFIGVPAQIAAILIRNISKANHKKQL